MHEMMQLCDGMVTVAHTQSHLAHIRHRCNMHQMRLLLCCRHCAASIQGASYAAAQQAPRSEAGDAAASSPLHDTLPGFQPPTRTQARIHGRAAHSLCARGRRSCVSQPASWWWLRCCFPGCCCTRAWAPWPQGPPLRAVTPADTHMHPRQPAGWARGGCHVCASSRTAAAAQGRACAPTAITWATAGLALGGCLDMPASWRPPAMTGTCYGVRAFPRCSPWCCVPRIQQTRRPAQLRIVGTAMLTRHTCAMLPPSPSLAGHARTPHQPL